MVSAPQNGRGSLDAHWQAGWRSCVKCVSAGEAGRCQSSCSSANVYKYRRTQWPAGGHSGLQPRAQQVAGVVVWATRQAEPERGSHISRIKMASQGGGFCRSGYRTSNQSQTEQQSWTVMTGEPGHACACGGELVYTASPGHAMHIAAPRGSAASATAGLLGSEALSARSHGSARCLRRTRRVSPGLVAPLPTWKDTPTTFRSRSLAFPSSPAWWLCTCQPAAQRWISERRPHTTSILTGLVHIPHVQIQW